MDYERLAAEVEHRLAEGFEAFNLVGNPASGKTHFLKALTYLLDRHAVGGKKASTEFHKADLPGPSLLKVQDYSYTGPAGEKWILLDIAGDIFTHMRENDWSRLEESVRLTKWLSHCKGLFCFLHLQPEHLGAQPLSTDPTLVDDPERRRRIEAEQARAQDAKQEIEFFKYFLLLLRAIRAEGGDVETVVETCRRSESLEEALRGYHDRVPLLDVPVMFFFTQADAYEREDFEIRPGLYVNPRHLPVPAAVFAARYLPSLFGAVASQARFFKFDFLQSYEDHPTEERDEGGSPVYDTYFHVPDDPELLLSAGLASGLEFVLRHRPESADRADPDEADDERRARPLRRPFRFLRHPRWPVPEIDSRRALLLHRLFHPGLWRGVPRNLLGGWWGSGKGAS